MILLYSNVKYSFKFAFLANSAKVVHLFPRWKHWGCGARAGGRDGESAESKVE